MEAKDIKNLRDALEYIQNEANGLTMDNRDFRDQLGVLLSAEKKSGNKLDRCKQCGEEVVIVGAVHDPEGFRRDRVCPYCFAYYACHKHGLVLLNKRRQHTIHNEDD